MTNIYRRHFSAQCPNNGKAILYELEIETNKLIQVEDVIAETTGDQTVYHETLADSLFARFGGRQILKAHHHGVDIETRRGFQAADHGRLSARVQVGSTVFEKGTEARHVIEAIGSRPRVD